MLIVKKWKKFQHFKDRRPPWIKLHRDVLDDMEWYELDPVAAKHLIMMWLIASEDETKEGRLPPEKELAFRLRITEKQLESTVSKLSHWLIHDDIPAISERYQDGPPEKRREETETEGETEGFSPDGMAKLWNERSSGCDLPKVLKLTTERRKKCLARISSLPLTEEKWRGVLDGIYASGFLTGQNDRKWVANFDWIIRNDENIVKVVEGGYR